MGRPLKKRKPRNVASEISAQKKAIEGRTFYCTSCPKAIPYTEKYQEQFLSCRSSLYAYNDYKIPICYDCLQRLFNQYMTILGDEKSALRRICMKFDMYYSEDCYNATLIALEGRNSTLLKMYASIIARMGTRTKTYDTTIEEERGQTLYGDYEFTFLDDDGVTKNPKQLWDEYQKKISDAKKELEEIEANKIPQDLQEKFGLGFSPDEYHLMEAQFNERAKEIPSAILASVIPNIKDECRYKTLEFRCFSISSGFDEIKKYSELYYKTKKTIDDYVKEQGKANSEDVLVYGITLAKIEKFCPADVYKNKKVFEDSCGIISNYWERLIVRPFKNFFTGSTEMDSEFSISSGDKVDTDLSQSFSTQAGDDNE